MEVRTPQNAGALDQRYALSRLSSGVVMAETFVRDAISGDVTPTKGRLYHNRITLKGGHAYTTVTLAKGATVGVSLANSYLALYDPTSLARVAVSADISTALLAVAASDTGTFTLNYTPAADGDYYLSLQIGNSTTTTPSLMGLARTADGIFLLDPILAERDSGTTLDTTPPDPTTFQTGFGGITRFWMRYA